MNRVVVVGGGVSGMTAAIAARDEGAEVVLLEHNDRLGKKLNATGNGRCNLGNAVLTKECYRGGEAGFVDAVFAKVSPEETRAWLSEKGLLLKDKRGYFYPHSEQAASVVTFFAARLHAAGVQVHCSAEVTKIKYEKKLFHISYRNLLKETNEVITADRLILATGGLAGQNLGASPFGYETAKSFGHLITPLFPALVQLVGRDKHLKTLSGVRTDARVTLTTVTDGNASKHTEDGEVLFTDYGISGIAVMQLSRYAGDSLRQGGTATVSLDFFPDYTEKELQELLKSRLGVCETLTAEDALSGMLPKKLMYVVLLRSGIAADTMYGTLFENDIRALCRSMKAFSLPIMQTKDYSMAQVTAGGVALSGIDPETLESKLKKGLYITGELLDVDGTCGGYNIQFALSTGLIAGRAASN
ncbi:MAG: NAD(P)/FAD-dependent oxidoreductase [Lachnospiraceae bacterium]|nr:NAD(P)/FAD-dependent oxidoreductase [Lachnospiraceae bacterium]